MRGALRTRLLPVFSLLAAPGLLSAQDPVPATTAFGLVPPVYDQARQRLLVVPSTRTVWEWDGVDWAPSAATLPAVPSRAVYDPTRQRVFYVCANRLVEFDGHAGLDRGQLPVANGSTLTVDTLRGRLLVCQALGGAVAGYEWDGANWLPIPSPGPTQSVLALEYDQARHRAVMQSLTLQPAIGFHTWEWDGAVWTLQATNSLVYAPCVFDPVRQQVVSVTTGTCRAWTGSQWVPITPSAPVNGTPTADPAHGRIWTFAQTAGGDASRFWTWDGVAWTSPMAAPHPMNLPSGTPLVYDPLRDRAIVLSLATLGQGQLQHREWDGTRWLDLTTATGPMPRTQHAAVFDAARGETVLFGGTGGNLVVADTWTWNGTQWRLAATTGPNPRTNAACTFDSVHGRVVLIGGNASSTVFTDHWEWDGAAWAQVAATTPVGGTASALGHDPLRDVLVHVDWSGTTFERSASGWTMLTPATPNLGNVGRTLTWDPVRQRLQGEMNANGVGLLHEWTGTAWVSRGASYGSTAWDARRGALLGFTSQRFVVGSPLPAAVADVGAPCGGTTTATSLTAFGRPRPGDTAFHLDVRAEATQRPALLGYSLGAGSTPLGNGCTLLLQNPFGSALWFTDANGCWHHPLPLPGSLALRGLGFVAQAAVLDPASPGGFALSQGLQLTIGD